MPSSKLQYSFLVGVLLACSAYLVHLIVSSLATLGIPWFWWFGLGLFTFSATVVLAPVVVEKVKVRTRRREKVRVARERAEAIDLGAARYEHCRNRDSYLEAKMLRRVA